MNEPVVSEGEMQDEQPPVPPPGGALGASSSASFASAVEVAVPTAAGETASIGFGDQAEQKVGGLEGDDEAGKLVEAEALREEDKVGGRGYVGKRFIQAAEVRYAVEYNATKPFRLVNSGQPVNSLLSLAVDLRTLLVLLAIYPGQRRTSKYIAHLTLHLFAAVLPNIGPERVASTPPCGGCGSDGRVCCSRLCESAVHLHLQDHRQGNHIVSCCRRLREHRGIAVEVAAGGGRSTKANVSVGAEPERIELLCSSCVCFVCPRFVLDPSRCACISGRRRSLREKRTSEQKRRSNESVPRGNWG